MGSRQNGQIFGYHVFRTRNDVEVFMFFLLAVELLRLSRLKNEECTIRTLSLLIITAYRVASTLLTL